MTPEETTHVIKAARQIGGVVASLGDVSVEDNRLHLTHEQLRTIIRDICENHKDAGNTCYSTKQIECLHHIAFQLFCILDPKTKPPETVRSALWKEIKALSILQKFGLVAGFLTAFAALTAIVEGGKSLFFGDKKTEQSNGGSSKNNLGRGA